MESSMNLDRSLRVRAALLFGALTLVSAFAASSASAGAIAGFPGVYESLKQKVCKAQTSCLVNFDAVPANTLLEATNINCLVNTVGPNPENLVMLNLFDRPPGGAAPIEKTGFPLLDANQGSPSTTVFGLNEQIRLFFRSSDFATATVGFDGKFDIAMTCTLSGNLLKKANVAL
jgi:hypothetical protein